jgi:hypothetical protein
MDLTSPWKTRPWKGAGGSSAEKIRRSLWKFLLRRKPAGDRFWPNFRQQGSVFAGKSACDAMSEIRNISIKSNIKAG